MGQSAGCRDGTCGNGTVVAVAQHDGQRDQAHRNHSSSYHACGGGKQGTHQDYGNRHTTAHGTKHLTHGFQEVFGHAGALQDDAHEGEERNGQQGVVLHDAKDAQWQSLEHGAGENVSSDTDEPKSQARCG